MRYFITFAYKGTDYHGSQSQINGDTVQMTLEQAMMTILRRHVPLTFAGRTDAGVHAEKMVAHFDFEELPENFLGRLNNYLPSDIAIRDITTVLQCAKTRLRSIYALAWHRDWISRQ